MSESERVMNRRSTTGLGEREEVVGEGESRDGHSRVGGESHASMGSREGEGGEGIEREKEKKRRRRMTGLKR